MGFASYTYLLCFLPAVVLGVTVLQLLRARGAIVPTLVLASILFYGWSRPGLVGLLALSIVVNYVLGRRLAGAVNDSRASSGTLLAIGVVVNVLPLLVFKYLSASHPAATGILAPGGASGWLFPLGLSFITFQHIAYLVDIYRGEPPIASFSAYCLFVAFFTKVTAGPIWRHAEFVEQLKEDRPFVRPNDVIVGLTIVSIGLAKKTVLGDGLAPASNAVFLAAQQGHIPTALLAWAGALSYTLQLYFDFSGYSDMAVGAGRLFGLMLPVNFESPYKSRSIVDFWKRWHISLSTLFFEFIYMPFVMTFGRRWSMAPYAALLFTMAVCGVWHGTGWTFLAWGALHGGYLCANHTWRRVHRKRPVSSGANARAVFSIGATFLAVLVGWVFFRAESIGAAVHMLSAMAGFGGGWGAGLEAEIIGRKTVALLLTGLVVVWGAPNTQELMAGDERLAKPWRRFAWRPTPSWAIYSGVLAAVSLLLMFDVHSEFIYFRF